MNAFEELSVWKYVYSSGVLVHESIQSVHVQEQQKRIRPPEKMYEEGKVRVRILYVRVQYNMSALAGWGCTCTRESVRLLSILYRTVAVLVRIMEIRVLLKEFSTLPLSVTD